MISPGSSKYLFLILVIFAVSFEIVADIMFKKWATENKNLLIVGGLCIYLVGTIIWAFSMRYNLFSKAVSIFSILNFVAAVLVGVFFFKEDLSLINKIGIALGLVSIVLIEI
jgi:multidrug transporter EmrE-like cation transporter